MSQTELSEHLGVSHETLKRWENGRTTPNPLAQSKLYALCKERKIPVYAMILQRIETIARSIRLEPGRVLLYHASKSGIEGRIEPKSRKQCDFGRGFYMGTEPGQALTLVCDYKKSNLYLLSVDMTQLVTWTVPVDIDWAMLVAYNRGRMEKIKGTPFYEKYRDLASGKDFILGAIANDRMFYVIDNFFIGNITDVALVHSLSALQLGKQCVAVSQAGCDAIRIEQEISLSDLERLFIKEVAEENRVSGVSLANDICKNYRREGLFFDEILDGATPGGIEWTQSH